MNFVIFDFDDTVSYKTSHFSHFEAQRVLKTAPACIFIIFDMVKSRSQSILIIFDHFRSYLQKCCLINTVNRMTVSFIYFAILYLEEGSHGPFREICIWPFYIWSTASLEIPCARNPWIVVFYLAPGMATNPQSEK